MEETLTAFRAELEAKFERVNKRIENGDNKHIKITGTEDKRRWSPIYPTDEGPINRPFYGQLPGIGIANLLWFVAEKTNLLTPSRMSLFLNPWETGMDCHLSLYQSWGRATSGYGTGVSIRKFGKHSRKNTSSLLSRTAQRIWRSRWAASADQRIGWSFPIPSLTK
jgi:hypothetical protein